MNIDSSHAPPRLLIVDDQPVNVQALYRSFAPDHQVFAATRGEQALQLAVQQRPDLILLDLELPDLHGLQVCARLKAQELTRDIPIIIVTAHGDDAIETQGLEAGAVDFIHKPINPAVVRARVKTHLTLKRQSDLLRQLAFVDGLTGLHNRRALDERLDAEMRHAARNDKPLSVLLLDVDFFKRYNDHHGHQAGDEALRRVAAALRGSMLRPADLAARYGGEEFACLLPETELDGALLVAERLRAAVEALQLPHGKSDAAECVTVSIGVAGKPGRPGGEPGHAWRAADLALYEAKRQGRNRVCGRPIPSQA
ncbi:diguanylate cyclase (GGDEF)-like protein [Inhella inkyongensis]|uniref:diguanylate cyclase n=1 Tax=Inhella inkyongensis TaxID=392593 RepID=A0A840S1Z6_9BURK|nr:diguanylate cyclase [Inhella inkyongensis]MBB5204325.1 diguanylate cyclase (GGDEF)-like protein [Inhella inkyongensis]